MILVISPQGGYVTKRLTEEAQKTGVPLEVLDMKELVDRNFEIEVNKYQALYIRSPYVDGSPKYLPNVIDLAKKFKAAGKKVVDAQIAEGNLATGKWADYQELSAANLPIPKTQLLGSNPFSLLPYPFVIKWTYGLRGKNVFLIQNENELEDVMKKYPADELLLQEFIEAEYEYKIITVGYKVLPVVLRFNIHPQTHRPDFKKYEVLEVRELENERMRELVFIAEQAAKLLKRELAKVDILESNGKFYILEVNRWPGLDTFEELTKYNVVEKFVEYLGLK